MVTSPAIELDEEGAERIASDREDRERAIEV
jgi:hypothetical protein